jgi:hypothetical protein
LTRVQSHSYFFAKEFHVLTVYKLWELECGHHPGGGISLPFIIDGLRRWGDLFQVNRMRTIALSQFINCERGTHDKDNLCSVNRSPLSRGVLTLIQPDLYKRKLYECHEHNIHFVVSRADPAELLDSSEQTFNHVPFLMLSLTILPWIGPVRLGWDYRLMPVRPGEPAGLLPLVRPVHQKRHALIVSGDGLYGFPPPGASWHSPPDRCLSTTASSSADAT